MDEEIKKELIDCVKLSTKLHRKIDEQIEYLEKRIERIEKYNNTEKNEDNIVDCDDKSFKLFVWEGRGVLEDYKSGLIVALARNFEEALEIIKDKYDFDGGNFPVNNYKIYKIDNVCCFALYGSA